MRFRNGMKWSGGSPFTAGDFVFWFEDIYGNKDIVAISMPETIPKGRPGRIVKVDEVTDRIRRAKLFFLCNDIRWPGPPRTQRPGLILNSPGSISYLKFRVTNCCIGH